MISTELARNIVRQLISHGIKDVVLSPGSRNAPLSIALTEAAHRGFIDLHVRIDERTAGFFALGIIKATKNRTAVVCTSGTAAANYYPAFLESFHSDLPLLVITADRPERLRKTGANQTTNQVELFNCGRFVEAVSPSIDLSSALAETGPVHLNVQFDEPLIPNDSSDWLANISKANNLSTEEKSEEFKVPTGKGVLIIGHDRAGFGVAAISDFARNLAVPIIAEDPLSFNDAIPHAALFANKLEVDWVFVVGRTTLSRTTNKLIAAAKSSYVLDPRAQKIDSNRTATKIFFSIPKIVGSAEEWQEHLSGRAAELISNHKDWSEPGVAKFLGENLESGTTLFISSSRPIRDIESFATPRSGIETFANRGLAGIDGNISTALGIASKREKTYAVIGDLAFLHDLTGLVNQEPINLKLIVLNNNGGGIFSTLPQANVPDFETIFGTPHNRDLVSIAKSFGIEACEITNYSDLKTFINSGSGLKIAICQMPDRRGNAELIKKLTPA